MAKPATDTQFSEGALAKASRKGRPVTCPVKGGHPDSPAVGRRSSTQSKAPHAPNEPSGSDNSGVSKRVGDARATDKGALPSVSGSHYE
jgi:hypothetical protein